MLSSVLALLCALLPFVAAQSSAPLVMVITSASGDGTCVNTGTVALNCTMPFTLSLSVEHLVFPLRPYVYIYPESTGPILSSLRLQASGSTNDTVLFSIDYDPFTVPAGVLYSYTIKDWSGGALESAPAPLFSIMPYPKPLIAAVSGCRQSLFAGPLLTTGCIADVDTLTLTGSGFGNLTSFGVLRTVGNVTENIKPKTALQWNAVVFNDSVMALALTDAVFLFLEEHYAGQLISLSLYWPSNYTSDAFNVTLAPLPAPQVTSYYSWSSRPVVVNNVTTYVDCVPGVTSVTITGLFLINLTITVGGVQAVRQDYNLLSPTYDVFTLPLVLPYNGTKLYDIVISNYGGTVVLPGAVRYLNTPFLSSVAPCYADIGPAIQAPMHCQGGDTLSISGGLFTQAGRTVAKVALQTTWDGDLPQCLSPVVVSDSLITCTLDAYSPEGPIGTYVYTQVTFSDGNTTNNINVGYLYDQPQAPRVLAIEGCAAGMRQLSNVSSGLALRGCELSDVITLYGAGFYRSGNASWGGVSGVRWYNFRIMPTFYCVNVTVLSNSSVTCALPTADEWNYTLPLTDYSMIIYDPADPYALVTASNAFIVSFGNEAEPPVAQPSSSSNVALAASLATVLSVLAVAGVAIAAYCVVRRRRAGQQSGAVSEDGRGLGWSKYEMGSARFAEHAWSSQSKSKDSVELSHK